MSEVTLYHRNVGRCLRQQAVTMGTSRRFAGFVCALLVCFLSPCLSLSESGAQCGGLSCADTRENSTSCLQDIHPQLATTPGYMLMPARVSSVKETRAGSEGFAPRSTQYGRHETRRASRVRRSARRARNNLARCTYSTCSRICGPQLRAWLTPLGRRARRLARSAAARGLHREDVAVVVETGRPAFRDARIAGHFLRVLAAENTLLAI